MWLAVSLAISMAVSCRDNTAGGAEAIPPAEQDNIISNTESVEDLTKLPHEPSDGLLLTTEILDEDNWIVALTWENVGDVAMSLRMAAPLKDEIDNGYAAPFLAQAYSRSESIGDSSRAVNLTEGRHSDSRLLDLTLGGEMLGDDTYDYLRELWGLPLSGSLQYSFRRGVNHLSLRPGDKHTCFFRFPRFKEDDEGGRWGKGERIPVDFRYFVGAEAERDNRVEATSGADGQPLTLVAPHAWQGEVSSNVVYLNWKPGGERVRLPVSSMFGVVPPEPTNDLLLSLAIEDNEKWIVRLTWKNVGKDPIELPVVEALEEDITGKNRMTNVSSPFLCTPGYYTNYRHYGRSFGSSLGWGGQVDERLFDLNRDSKHSNDAKAYEALLALDGQRVDYHRIGGSLTGTKWHHLEPGEGMSVKFRFPRFESDDREKRWEEGEKIPLEFCFKAGEIPNSRPPEREERIGDDIRLRRYPAWQGEVFSNVVFFTWVSGGERVKWNEPAN